MNTMFKKTYDFLDSLSSLAASDALVEPGAAEDVESTAVVDGDELLVAVAADSVVLVVAAAVVAVGVGFLLALAAAVP
jgi:hypothetical protein